MWIFKTILGFCLIWLCSMQSVKIFDKYGEEVDGNLTFLTKYPSILICYLDGGPTHPKSIQYKWVDYEGSVIAQRLTLTLSPDGFYETECVVTLESDDKNETFSKKVTIEAGRIIAQPRLILKSNLNPSHLSEGKDYKILCSTSTKVNSMIFWFYRGTSLIERNNKAIYTIKSASPWDSGDYSCLAKSNFSTPKFSSKASNTLTLKIGNAKRCQCFYKSRLTPGYCTTRGMTCKCLVDGGEYSVTHEKCGASGLVASIFALVAAFFLKCLI